MRRIRDRRYYEVLATLHLAHKLYRFHVRHYREYQRYAKLCEWFALHHPLPTALLHSRISPQNILGLIVQHTNSLERLTEAGMYHSRSDDDSSSVYNLRA
eukprot:602490-Prymnesium_polylepis.1